MAPRLLPPSGSLQRALDVLGDTATIAWEADPVSRRFTSVSRSAEDVTGFPPGAWTGDESEILERIHPDDRPHVVATWTRAGEGDRFDVEYRFATKEGREVRLWQVGQLAGTGPRARL